MSTQNQNFVYRRLVKANGYFRKKNAEKDYTIDPENHKIVRHNGIIKNFLRLTNKTFIGMSKIRVNKTAIFSCFLGLGLGYLCSELDQKMSIILQTYRPLIKEALIKEVLRNQDLKSKLNDALIENVYNSPDIQYKLSQVLMNEAIKPQQEDLFLLSKKGIIEALQSQAVRKEGAKAAANALQDNGQIIGNLALQFIGGPFLRKVISQKVSSLLNSEQVSETVSSQAKDVLKKQLNADGTRQTIYSFIREKFVA